MTVLAMDRVTVRIAGKSVLQEISVQLSSSNLVIVVGPNGAGKTTLIRTALGLLKPIHGSVTLDGVSVGAIPGRARAAKLAWLPQRGVLAEPITALDFVAAARFRFDEGRKKALDGAEAALVKARAHEFAGRRITELSGGEFQRVLIASVLAQEAPLILLDEPATSLDPAQQINFCSLIGRLWKSGLGILWVTHDINAIAYTAGKDEAERATVVGLKEGRVAFTSTYGAPSLEGELERLFGVAVAAVSVGGHRLFVTEPGGRREAS